MTRSDFEALFYDTWRLSTSSNRQVLCNHPDMTAVNIWSADNQIQIFSVYIPPVPMHTPEETSARWKCQLLEMAQGMSSHLLVVVLVGLYHEMKT